MCERAWREVGFWTDGRSCTGRQSDLEFELRLQQFIELVRTRQTAKLLEATAHARKYLTGHADAQHAIRAAGLLAFPPHTPFEPYKVSCPSSPPLLASLRPHHRSTNNDARTRARAHTQDALQPLPLPAPRRSLPAHTPRAALAASAPRPTRRPFRRPLRTQDARLPLGWRGRRCWRCWRGGSSSGLPRLPHLQHRAQLTRALAALRAPHRLAQCGCRRRRAAERARIRARAPRGVQCQDAGGAAATGG